MNMNQEGQITIPKKLRELMGIEPRTPLDIGVSEEGILIKPLFSHREKIIRWLREEHADEIATLTTDQIMRLSR